MNAVDVELREACSRVVELAQANGVSVSGVVRLITEMMRAQSQGAWTAEHTVVRDMAAMYEAGATGVQIAAAYDVSLGVVYRRLRLAGACMRKPGPPRGLRNLERARAMAEMYEAGATLKEVGERHGVSSQRVHQVMQRLGVSRRPVKTSTRRPVILRAHAAGLALREIARVAEVSRGYAAAILHEAGLSPPRCAPVRTKPTKLAAALKLFDAGCSIAEITKLAGYKSEASCRVNLCRRGRTMATRRAALLAQQDVAAPV